MSASATVDKTVFQETTTTRGMIILPDYARPYIVDSLSAPLTFRHMWVLNAKEQDFMLQKITYLEELSNVAMYRIRVNGSEFWVPSTWNILIIDPDTSAIDFIGIKNCRNIKYQAFLFSPHDSSIRFADITVVDYIVDKSIIYPAVDKGNALAHAVGPIWTRSKSEIHASVLISPHDLYKYIANKSAGDILA